MMATFVMLAQTAPEATGLTVAGAIIMTVSIGGVLALSAFCMNKILREKQPSQHDQAPLDIDTHDRET
ncbi:MAG: hypothetical protein IID33_05600 [Planctomycetes bacterium]|nr:hypothetical protein [Planctomycetota bacterium]